MLLITPTWHTQPSYPSLLQMSIETPVILPRINSLLKDPLGKEYPLINNKTLRLAAWKMLGRDYLCQGFREQLPDLLLSQGSSTGNYESAWRKWLGWCCRRQTDPVSWDITPILDFLGELFDAGYEYRTINSHRSAISAYHQTIDGKGVGSNDKVCKLLSGVFNLRPPQP